MTVKISIIVPVYNTENYLRECLDSIIHQTYEDLEIILVDDGSTDHCGEICDSYASQDARIRVIHQKNAGLSAARNAGLDISAGEWISFIDSDDYVSPCFIELMYNAAVSGNSEIAALSRTGDFWNDKPDRPRLETDPNALRCQTISVRDALELLLYMKIETSVQYRIYKRLIFENIRFPDGFYEDVAASHKLFAKANRVTIVHNLLYAYRKRNDGITRQSFSEKKLIALDICRELVSDPIIHEMKLQDAACARAFSMSFSVFLQVPPESKDILDLCWENLLLYRGSVLRNHSPYMRGKNKYGAIITLFGKDISYFLGRKFGQRGSFQ